MSRIAFAVLAVVLFAYTARAADPIKIPFKVIQAAFKQAECTTELQDEDRSEVQELGGGLKLVEIYCWRAAYQAGSIFLAVDPKAPDKARLLRFHLWSDETKRLVVGSTLSNPNLDEEKKMMSAGHKGRGVGDCGTAGEWKWTGRDFMLMRFWSKPDCDGQPFDDDRRWQVYPPR